MSLVLSWIFFNLFNTFLTKMTENNNNKNSKNYNETQPFVVGILSPSTTVYIDQIPTSNREISPPTDLNLRRRNNSNSFQITSVTVQGSRKNDDFADDSADDLDESHTDDLSSDFLDSSKADNEGYHSEVDSNPIMDDLSPCGPIIFAQLPSRDPNMNLSLGVTPTYTAIGPNVVAGGVTMMTSKSESPISAQVPIMNPLPDNWQRRFKVVKIVSSEPFKRGRWMCMDFKDPPTNGPLLEHRNDSNGTNTPPTIQITHCESNDEFRGGGSGDFTQVYELPMNQAFNGNFILGNQQQMYGIILPQSEHLQPVTLVQDMSLQTTIPMDQNFNNLTNNYSEHVVTNGVESSPLNNQRIQTLVNDRRNVNSPSPPSSLSANNNNNSYNNNNNNENNYHSAVPNHVNGSGRDSPVLVARTNSEEIQSIVGSIVNVVMPSAAEDLHVENSESFSSLASELSRTSGLSHGNPLNIKDLRCSPPLKTTTNCKLQSVSPPLLAEPLNIPPCDVTPNTIAPVVVAPPTVSTLTVETNSSQNAPEKIPPSEVGHEDPSSGSTASTGGNTVAIDNKIEQAMDLVKSHLMFAVREEVEVLKEKITELLERISQLEHENDILRANASAETLKQLNNQKKNSAGGGKPQSIAPVPPST